MPLSLRVLLTVALLSFPVFAAQAPRDSTLPETTYEPGLPPAQAGARLIQAFIAGDAPAQIAPFFDSAVGPLSEETVAGFRSQLEWMANVLGDALQVFAEGSRTAPDGSPEYYREYRFAHEADRRHPMVLVQLQFADSLSDKATGAFVKTFLAEKGERKLAGTQAWKMGKRALEVHSVSLLELPEGFLLFVKVEDGDTASLETREAALPYSAPIARELVARGWIDSARAAMGSTEKPLLEPVGVLFMRVDPTLGYTHFRHTVRPEEYALAEKDPAAGKKAKAKKTK